jgi:hypothetical protein
MVERLRRPQDVYLGEFLLDLGSSAAEIVPIADQEDIAFAHNGHHELMRVKVLQAEGPKFMPDAMILNSGGVYPRETIPIDIHA